VSNLIDEYREHAIGHGVKSCDGDFEAANRHYDLLFEIAACLVNSGRGEELLFLLDDSNRWVQLWAATHSLEIDEKRGLTRLEELGAGNIPMISMGAQYTLQSWKSGEANRIRKDYRPQ
jgi:hypothetical protein